MPPGTLDGKLIYSLKIYLFRSQFWLTKHELSSLGHFTTFVLKVYLKAWFTSPCAPSAPQNDLLIWTLVVLKWNPSWLSILYPKVSHERKSAMVAALDKITTEHPRRIAFKPILLKKSDFVSQNTRQLFTALDIPQRFLTLRPDVWESDNGYIVGQRKVRSLKVVNDAAERGVALIQEFNGNQWSSKKSIRNRNNSCCRW